MKGQLPSGPATRQLIHWIIDGGESGPRNRLADPKWFRFIREQCKEANIPYFHKQNGGTRKQDGHWGGNKLDGKIYNEMPEV